jgi:hypothetical protein
MQDELNQDNEQNLILSDNEIQINDAELSSVFEVIKTRKNIKQFGIEIEIDAPKRGRPSVMTKDVLVSLSEAWLIGSNDEEACTYAGIHPASLYAFQKDKPEFLEYKEHLKRNPILKARMALYKALDDPNYAWKYLQKKAPDLQDDPTKGGGNINLNIQLNQLVEQDRKREE